MLGRPPARALLEGPPLRSLVTLAVPIVVANVLQTAYQLTDTFWVGRLGAEAVAAVSLSFPIVFLLMAIGGGLSIAGTVLVAHHVGAGEREAVDHVAGQTVLAMLGASAVVTVAGVLAARPLVALMGAEPGVLEPAVAYLRLTFLGITFVFGYFVFQSLMRGVGEVRLPVVIVLATVLLNFVADPLFILGWGPVPAMGVSGAAAATVVAQGLAAVAGVGLLVRGRHGVRVRARALVPDLALLSRLVRLGVPASLEQTTQAAGIMVLTFLVASFGTLPIAAYGIGGRLQSLVIIPALGLSMATATLVGQNLGAGQRDRALAIARLSAWVALGTLTAAGLVVFALARPLSAVLIPGDPAVIAESARLLHIMSPAFGLLGLQIGLAGSFRGAGDTRRAMTLALVSMWMFRFPFAYLLSHHTRLGHVGIWWSFPASYAASALVAWVWFRGGRWLDARPTARDREVEEVAEEAVADEGPPPA
jgi:putative MATE family efflux protein